MPADVSDQLRDLAGWIDDRWVPEDPAQIRDPGRELPRAEDPRPRGPARAVAIAACLVLVVGIVAVALRARQDSSVISGGPEPGAPLVEGAMEGWTRPPDLPYSDRWLGADAPAVWTGRELLVVGGLTEALPPGAEMPMSEGLTLLETPAFDPATSSWRTLPAPPVRMGGPAHAVWTGTEVLVVSSSGFAVGPGTEDGGSTSPCSDTTGAVITVASLDPAAGTWTVRSEPTVQAGRVSDLVWDGTRAWLAFDDACVLGYDPAADTYATPIAPDADEVRSVTAEVSTPTWVESAALAGSELLLSFTDVVGLLAVDLISGAARDVGAPPFRPADTIATGAGVVRIYGPSERAAVLAAGTGSWRELEKPPLGPRNLVSRPSWTGTQVLVWGGSEIKAGRSDPLAEGYWQTDGALLDPVAGTWSAIPAGPDVGPMARSAWAGDRLVVWSGGNAFGSPDGVIQAAVWQP